MSVRSQVQSAEEALRQALINALAEGDEDCLSELFTQYQAVSNLNKKVQEKITFNPDLNFNINSDYFNTNRIGGDLDSLDDVITFGGDTVINTDSNNDTITFL